MALEAKKRGATTLCITSLAHASAAAPRNPAGLRLHEACDIVLDNEDGGDEANEAFLRKYRASIPML